MTTRRTFFRSAAPILALVLAAFGSTPSAALAGEVITLDTALVPGLAGTTGYLDFQFNPGNADPPFASAAVSSFTSDGTLGALYPPNIGNVSGDIYPGDTLTIANNNGSSLSQNNEYTVGFKFGTTMTFDVAFTGGSSASSTDGSTLYVTFYDTNFSPLLGPNGQFANSAIAVTLIPTAGGGPPTVTNFLNPQLNAVPEPSTLVLTATGAAMGLVVLGRRARGRVLPARAR